MMKADNKKKTTHQELDVASNHAIIIIMEICKVSTLQLKALNKHSITHVMYIEMEMLSAIKKKMYIRKREKANT